MTPVREALEPCPFCGAAPVIEPKNNQGPLWIHCANDECMGPHTTAGTEQDAIVQWNTRASAAPGEPCAVKPLEWHKHPDDNEWYSIDEGHYQISDYVVHHSPNSDGWCLRVRGNLLDEDYPTHESAKAAAQADYEQRIRSALVTTPQPAAGWDEAIEVCIRELQYCRDHGHEPDITTIKKLTALRREAPAPAEGKGTSVTEDQIKHMVDRFLGWKLPENFNPDGGVSFKRLDNRHHHPDAPPFYPMPTGTNLFDAIQATEMVRYMIDGLPARPDTAEARLREAFVQVLASLAAAISLLERTPKANKAAPSDTMFAIMLDDYRKALGAGRKALSPPSGGDEAKESEGGGGSRPALKEERIETTNVHEDRTTSLAAVRQMAGVAPSPSEPSPPADRREIVARIIDPDAFSMIPGQSWEALARMEAQSEAQLAAERKADAILAARAQSDDASRKREG